MSPLRALPIRVEPLPGEALDSWLESVAHRLHTRLADLLGVLALADYAGRGDRRVPDATRWTVQLPAQVGAKVAAMTGVGLTRLAAMTLARYDGTVLRIDPARQTVDRRFLWGRGSRSRFCPDCLAETGGRWQLWWRLGWAFACPLHHQLLADLCPGCHRPQRQRFAPRHVIPQPGRCAHPPAGQSGLAEQRCSTGLAGAPVLRLPSDHPALAAQRALLETIHAGTATFGTYSAHPQPVPSALADLRALANRILTYATVPELSAILPADLLAAHTAPVPAPSKLSSQRASRPGFMAPPLAATAAAGITAAVTILDAPDVRAAGAALHWLVDGSRRDGITVSATSITNWGRGSSPTLAAVQLAALDPLLPATDRLRYRTMSAYPRQPSNDPAVANRRARQVPTLFWPAWSLRLSLPSVGHQFYRLALSNALLIIGTRLSLTTTVSKLGSSTSANGAGRVLQLMLADPHWPQLAAALLRLADHLDTHGAPIDYERRGQLVYDALLPDDVWIGLCRRLGRPARKRSATVARAVLFERLSGLPAEQAPGGVDDNQFKSAVASFPRRLSPELSACLQQAAHDFLRAEGIDDEPLTWQPPLDLLADLSLPGPDPALVDLAALHRVVQEPDVPLEVVAERLDITIDTVRYLLGQHPLPHVPARRQVRARVRPTLSREEFVRLYQGERLSLYEIADQIGVSRGTVARLAEEYGVAVRQPGLSAKNPIDRDWLHEQYVVQRRTLPDLAREASVSTMTMNRWAHVHGIPLRSRGTGGHRQYLQREYTQDTIDPAWLFEQYVVRRRPMPDLARELGVSNASLYSWARVHGIPIRPKGRQRSINR